MIGEGQFRANLSEGFKLLQNLSLAAYRNYWPAVDSATTDLLRSSTTYIEVYSRYINRQAYDFLLDDGSFFFFRRNLGDPTILSYGFFESPYHGVSYTQFASDIGDRDDAWQAYEEYCAQLPTQSHVLPVRYDWSPALYREGAHPAAHLHMGYESDMRLAVDAMLLPLQFVLFVIRHFYVTTWETTASRLNEVARAAGSISDSAVVPQYRQERDHLELRLVAVHHSRTVVQPRHSQNRHR
jgi:hypothetical protein